MMNRFEDWSIRNKLILPLFAVMVLGGGGSIWAVIAMHDKITNDALPKERALDDIRRVSFELLSEYREFMIVPSDSTQGEINELKEDEEVYMKAFADSAGAERLEAGFVEAIEAAERNMIRIGDETIAARLQLLDRINSMVAFEAAIEHVRYLPQAELHDLVVELRSLTLGVGSFDWRFDHLQELTGKPAETTGTRGSFTIPHSIASMSEKSFIVHGKSVPSA